MSDILTDIVHRNDSYSLPITVIPSPSSPIAVFWSPDCEKHTPPSDDHPENPDRITSVMKHIIKYKEEIDLVHSPPSSTSASSFSAFSAFSPTFQSSVPTSSSSSYLQLFVSKPATKNKILLFHSEEQWTTFCQHCKKANDDYFSASNKTREVLYDNVDMDTYVMWATSRAALSSVGAVIDACDLLLSPSSSNIYSSAFCAIRPPGHHSTPTTSMGFCYFNNIGIGAKYVLSNPEFNINRVAILDFDVHHGNGTDAGARLDPRIFYGSTHERNAYPNVLVEEEEENRRKNGEEREKKLKEEGKIDDDNEDHLYKRIINIPLTSGKLSRREFRKYWIEIIKKMIKFSPQIIFLSAGFDAHDEDPLSDIELIEDDYAWITRLVKIAALKLGVKIISALEGGYDVSALSTSVVTHLRALNASFEADCDELNEEDDERMEEVIEEKKSKFGGDEAASLAATIKSLGL